MQAITVAVQPNLVSVDKINAIAPHSSTAVSSESEKQVSFSERVEQAKKEQPAQKSDSDQSRNKIDKTAKTADDASVKKSTSVKAEEIKDPSAKKSEQPKNTKNTAVKETKTDEKEKSVQKQKKGDDKKTKKTQDEGYQKELAYLQGSDPVKRPDTPDAILAQVQEYNSTDSEQAKVGLQKAQRMSVESPRQFLEMQTSANAAKHTDSTSQTAQPVSFEKDGKTSKKKEFALDKDGKIIVKDLRTEADKGTVKDVKGVQNKAVVSVQKDGDNSSQMTMTLPDNVQQNILSSSDQSASAAGSNFQAMLTNQIQQNAGDFVKAGSIVLKDNNVGTIKLVLHPESLGNVKINLQLSDKVVTGQITVASQEAYNAFRESADSLKQAFIQNGFDTSGFTVSYSGANTGNGSGSSFQNGKDEEGRAYSVAAVSGSYDNAQLAEAVPAMGGTYTTSAHSLNIVA
jgi:Flagellar hook-length control protein FliK.